MCRHIFRSLPSCSSVGTDRIHSKSRRRRKACGRSIFSMYSKLYKGYSMSLIAWMMRGSVAGAGKDVLGGRLKKLGAILGLGLLAAASQAGTTITMTNVPCTQSYICSNVPNDAGVTLNYVDDVQAYGRVLVNMNGDVYDSGIYAIARYAPVNDLALYDAAGKVMYATLNFVKVSTGPCARQGRVTVCPYAVTLTKGTLVLP